jgi:hypothetical protein
LGRGKLIAAAHVQNSEQTKPAGQVSVKLTPEICINNATSNSRLTAAGRQATAADIILRTVSRLFFFSFLSPYL